MVVYKCSKCSKEFAKKCNFEYHLKRKFPCVKPEPAISCGEIVEISSADNFVCKFCSKSYTRKDSLVRHMKKSCNPILQIKEENLQMKEENLQIKEENLQMKEEIAKLRKKSEELENKLNSHSFSKTNIENQNNINITLVNFGGEDFDKLTKQEILKIINSRYGGLRNYVEFTHLNDRLPEGVGVASEQQNVLISNLRSNECKVIENNK